ncbi:zinc finger C3HC4-type RING finger family protein [Striga asiatica]|uniref:Zinc finger C3HC4-type RING finger family protein n=1 Tax=Striga asiatica TaxID=4170 RepID=A0A5A7PAJ7_STRAF|nr:zinc finger C3HC4-type RING finger family protein [Striga asiatica]
MKTAEIRGGGVSSNQGRSTEKDQEGESDIPITQASLEESVLRITPKIGTFLTNVLKVGPNTQSKPSLVDSSSPQKDLLNNSQPNRQGTSPAPEIKETHITAVEMETEKEGESNTNPNKMKDPPKTWKRLSTIEGRLQRKPVASKESSYLIARTHSLSATWLASLALDARLRVLSDTKDRWAHSLAVYSVAFSASGRGCYSRSSSAMASCARLLSTAGGLAIGASGCYGSPTRKVIHEGFLVDKRGGFRRAFWCCWSCFSG